MLMLDTNICIYIIKKRPPSVLKHFQSIKTEQICISVITYAELQYGVDKSSAVAKNQLIIDDFISRLSVINWDEKAAQFYGKIRSNLEKKGTPIGLMDVMIAAHCLSLDCTLITNNIKEFERIPNLKSENWV